MEGVCLEIKSFPKRRPQGLVPGSGSATATGLGEAIREDDAKQTKACSLAEPIDPHGKGCTRGQSPSLKSIQGSTLPQILRSLGVPWGPRHPIPAIVEEKQDFRSSGRYWCHYLA